MRSRTRWALAGVATLLTPAFVISGPFTAPAAAADCVPVDAFHTGALRPDMAGLPAVAGANFGSAVAAGDFDKDGYADMAVGAPNDVVNGNASGAVYIFPGSASGPRTGAGVAKRLTQANISAGDEAGDRFGAALAVGDFNKDGYADLAVGIPGEAVGSASGAGAIGYFLGGPSGLTTGVWRDQEPTGGAAEAGDNFGHALAAADFNKDGYADLAIGVPGEAPGSDPKSGAIAVFRGSSGGLVNGYGFNQESFNAGTNESGDRFGYSVAAGDINADGYPDLAIGAPGEAPGSEPAGGAVYVTRGSSGGLGSSGYGVHQEELSSGGTEAGDEFGFAVAIGNFDGNAYPDIAVGVPGEAPGGGSDEQPTSGDVAVIYGGTSSTPSGYWIHSYDAGEVAEDGDRFGSVLAAGDVDADGRADLLVGSFAKNTDGQASDAGVAYLFGGTTRGLDLGRRIAQTDIGWGHETNDRFGSAAALVDITGDGRPEALIGARGEAGPGLPASGSAAWIEGLVSGLGLGGLVGATTETTAKIWVRGNDAGQFQVQYRPAGATDWTTGPAVAFGSLSGADLTAVSTLAGLTADTRYEYRIAVNCRVVPFSTGRFRTLAPATADSVRFAFGADTKQVSAQSADTGVRTQKPFRILDKVVANDPAFMIYGGDNIYGDRPSESTTTAAYLAKYRENWGEVNYRAAMAGISSYMTWDDHEIDNDWPNESIYQGKDPAAQYAQARPAFNIYQASHNPAPRVAGELYYSFRSGPVDVFVLDTRTHRTQKLQPANDPTRTMLGATQLAELKSWLSTSTAPYKVIVSSSPFAQRACGSTAPAEGHDSWCGYTYERSQILNHITANNIGNVVVVSGDRHWSGVFRLNTGAGQVPVTEVIATPLGIGPGSPPCPLPSSCSSITNEQTLWTDENKRYAFGLFDVASTGMTVTLRDEANAVMYQIAL